MTKTYKVAGHLFNLSLPDGHALWGELGQYSPFEVPFSDSPIFSLEVVDSLPEGERTLVLDPPVEEGETVIRLFRQDSFWFAEMSPESRIPTVAHLMMLPDFTKGRLCFISHKVRSAVFAINNALMLMYAFRTATEGTLEMHASVIRCQGRAFLFLAKSGTGKSTHSNLWLKHVPGSELLNDDNPIVRIYPDGRVICYGSPWSGKTPCYRNIEAPVGAFVRISRAPENSIEQLDIFKAYATLYSSSSGFKANRAMADGLYSSISGIVGSTRCFVLHCRPDEEAARVCSEAVL